MPPSSSSPSTAAASSSPLKRRRLDPQPSLLNFFPKPASPTKGADRPSQPPLSLRKSSEQLDIDKALKTSLADAASSQSSPPSSSRNQQAAAGTARGSTSSPGSINGSSTTAGDRLTECPVCSHCVPFRTIEAHVNTCLDTHAGRPGFPPSIDAASETRSAEQAALLRNGAAKNGRRSPSCSPAPPSRSATPAQRRDESAPDVARMFPISQLTDRLEAGTRVFEANTTAASPSHSSVAGNAPPPALQPAGKYAPPAPAPAPATAFTMLMKPHSEAKQWATADAVEAANYRGRARNRPDARTPPFYKILEGMPLSVDAFRFGRIDGCRGYFLSHFHSDHYGGLSSSWCHGPVYCSVTTANLCRTSLGVDEKWLRPLPMETPTLIPDSGGVTVTCIDANHCPGSCLFLFEGPQTAQLLSRSYASPHIGTGKQFRYLHCGDFRASPMHTNHPRIRGKRLDIIYLDTTYCNPRYCFPAQDQVVEACAELVRRLMPVKTEEEEAEQRARRDAEVEEDWRLPPKMNAAAKAARAQSSASAKAFKGWLGSGPPPAKMEGDGGNDDAQDAADDADDADDDEEPLLEDEDSMLAAGRGQPGMLGFENEEQELWRAAEVAGRSAEASPSAVTPGSPRVKKEEGEEEEDNSTAASTSAPAIVKKEEDDSDATAPTDSKNWLAKQSHASKASASLGRQTGRLLVVVGTYTIGKEKVVKAVAQTMATKVFCVDSRKYRVYSQLEDAELHSLLTRDPNRAAVHVTNLHAINGDGLRDMVAALRARGCGFTHAIAFRPTGWTYKPPSGMDTVSPNLDRLIEWNQNRNFGPAALVPTRDSTPEYMIYGVPYSEHSSFFELTSFALSTSYNRIIATVNVGSPASRAKMDKWFERWASEKRKRVKAGIAESDMGPKPRSLTYW